MTRAHLTALALAGLVVSMTACETSTRCPVPGVTSTCACPNGSGARVCGDDHVWRACDCSGAIGLPNPITNEPATSGTGGTTTTGGTGGTTTTGGTGVSPDDDGGVDPSGGTGGIGATGGTGGIGATGGTGGVMPTGGTGGAAGTEPMPMPPYRACMVDADCDSGACVVTPGFTTLSVCAPACIDVGDCPVPEGTYEATPVCESGYCKIDCTAAFLQPLLTCPTGMTCVVPLGGISHCHDDGV